MGRKGLSISGVDCLRSLSLGLRIEDNSSSTRERNVVFEKGPPLPFHTEKIVVPGFLLLTVSKTLRRLRGYGKPKIEKINISGIRQS